MNSRLSAAKKRLRRDLADSDRIYVEVRLYSPQAQDEATMLDDYKLLADEGLVVLHDQQDFAGNYPTAQDGRVICHAWNYRVTSHGMEASTPFAVRAIFNVLNNIPTLITAVFVALAVDWSLSYFGAPKEESTMSEINQTMEPKK